LRHGVHHDAILCLVLGKIWRDTAALQTLRVFYDRLVDDADRAWLFTYVRDVVNAQMNTDFDSLFAHLSQGHVTSGPPGHVTEDQLRSLVFCDFADRKVEARHYAEVRDVEQLRHVVENYLDEFNSNNKKPMDLVLFRSVSVCVCFLRQVYVIQAGCLVFTCKGAYGAT